MINTVEPSSSVMALRPHEKLNLSMILSHPQQKAR